MRILLSSLLLLVFISCNQAATTTSSTVVPEKTASSDSLIAVWNNAWNKRDSVAIASQFTDDAVMLNAAKTMNGKAEILNRFVSHFYKSMVNLQTQKVYEAAATDIVVQAGTYQHDVQASDGSKKSLSGGYTFVWKQQADKSWKLCFLELE